MSANIEQLIGKYNIAVPRYTSYPTVPYWDKIKPEIDAWLSTLKATFTATNATTGISLYLHLPYCESLCTYCGCNTRITVNHQVELPYIESLLKEWKLYLNALPEKPRIAEIHLGGGTPTFFAPENLVYLISSILEEAVLTEEPELSFEGHPKNTSYEHLKQLREIGFNRVSFGIQDFDPTVQDAINRYQSFEEVKAVTDNARTLGYTSVNYDLVYGLPFQKLQTVKDTIKQVCTLKPDRIAFYSYAHVPWLKPSQRKYTEMDLPAEKEKLDLYFAGYEIFKENGYVDVGMDHFSLETDSLYKAYKQGLLHRNFMGYTTNNTKLMIGLGVSSISDSWGGFVQNAKVVEEYQALVNKGEFPFFKGHILSAEDLIVRKHILDLICTGFTRFESDANEIALLQEAIAHLEPVREDGLVEVGADYLKVTSKGERFIRNICLCLDRRYWHSVPAGQIFSKAI